MLHIRAPVFARRSFGPGVPIDGHWPPPWLMNETIRAKLAGISRINIFTSRFSEHSIFGNFAERLA
ncbi:hypothetical protein DO64_5886 [Burkholderia pseudomallei]|nr:hypothetical protein DO64_5886 [Burkholderia pseudomallei]KGW19253.1 hypothetical protein X882_5344 [Burkholderia pseudomallei MSHR4303]